MAYEKTGRNFLHERKETFFLVVARNGRNECNFEKNEQG